MVEAIKNSGEIERDEKGRILPGQPPLNPAGRPKGKTLKEYAREYYMLKTDEEKTKYIEMLEEKKPGFAWTMAEGNPATNTDITSGGMPIYIPAELLNKNQLDDSASSTKPDSE